MASYVQARARLAEYGRRAMDVSRVAVLSGLPGKDEGMATVGRAVIALFAVMFVFRLGQCVLDHPPESPTTKPASAPATDPEPSRSDYLRSMDCEVELRKWKEAERGRQSASARFRDEPSVGWRTNPDGTIEPLDETRSRLLAELHAAQDAEAAALKEWHACIDR